MTDIDSSAHDHLTMDRLRTEALDPRNGMSPPDMKPKDKGKSRAFNLGALSFSGTPSSTPPKNNIVEHDPQTNSYLLPLPSSTSGQDTTPTTSFMKSPPRPPARSPLRQSQQPSPRPKTIDPPPFPNEASSGESSKPIPRQGKGGLDAAARAKRREAYKSGMSFVSLYELYSEDVPPVPVPPLPSLDRSKLDTDPAFAKRARSGSTASIGATREGKNSQQSIAPAAIVNHSWARSGSSSASPLKSPGHVSRPSRDAAIAIAGPQGGDSLRLSNATISSSIPTTPASAPIPTPESGASKSKRQHVLFEILETERIYSSDMALVRQVHLPLALGMKVDLGPMGSTTGSARSSGAEAAQAEASRISGISTNTASSSQSQSGSSGYPVSTSTGYVLANEPPMSVEDTKVIFANLDELAEFAGRFTELIELALGSEIEGGVGPDKIGNLFLEMVCVTRKQKIIADHSIASHHDTPL
ncbi:hypothetical protein FRC20_001211 [Serendipita sp. 405]|nr:hypothetical protein FRC20_001211 [Serendipita sp. 405]